MECLAILNRLSVFCNNPNERAELCTLLEREAERLNPEDIPLTALEAAVQLLADNSTDIAIIRCTSAFLSSCALGDSQVVRKYLLQLSPLGSVSNHTSGVNVQAPSMSSLPFCVATVNRALEAGVVNNQSRQQGDWKLGVQPLTDLIATLGYNNGAFRSAFGVAEGSQSTLQLLKGVLTRLRVEGGGTPTPGNTDYMSNPHASALYYTVSCVAVLLMTDARNSSDGLTMGLIAEVLHVFKCLHVGGAGPQSRRPGSIGGTVGGGRTGRVGSSNDLIGLPTRYPFANNEAKSEIGKWCVQVMRNAVIAAPTHPAWDILDRTLASRPNTAVSSSARSDVPLDFGRMGDIIAVDELKWDLAKVRKRQAAN